MIRDLVVPFGPRPEEGVGAPRRANRAPARVGEVRSVVYVLPAVLVQLNSDGILDVDVFEFKTQTAPRSRVPFACACSWSRTHGVQRRAWRGRQKSRLAS